MRRSLDDSRATLYVEAPPSWSSPGVGVIELHVRARTGGDALSVPVRVVADYRK